MSSHYDEDLLTSVPEATKAQLQSGYNPAILAENTTTTSSTAATTPAVDPEVSNQPLLPVHRQSEDDTLPVTKTKVPFYATTKGIVGIVILVAIIIGAVVGGAVGGTRKKKTSSAAAVGGTSTTAMSGTSTTTTSGTSATAMIGGATDMSGNSAISVSASDGQGAGITAGTSSASSHVTALSPASSVPGNSPSPNAEPQSVA